MILQHQFLPIARRTGIPITLAVVAIEVGARCGVPLQGVPFPSHFLVRTPEAPPVLGDPFHFRLVSDSEATERLKQSLGPEARLEPVFLRPASTRQTLVRMCSNLKHIHVGKQEWLRAIGLCDRILLLAPEMATEHRDRAVLYARLECFGPPLADLEKYLELEPNAEDAEAVRENVEQLRPLVRSINQVAAGKYLVLLGGQVADVEESLAAGREIGGPAVLDFVFLPQVHPEVVGTIGGARAPAARDALGIVETTTVAAAIQAADAGVKGAFVRLVELRLADGLGGKGLVLFSGLVADVEAAVKLGTGALERKDLLVREVVIPQLHPGMWENVSETTWFAARVTGKL